MRYCTLVFVCLMLASQAQGGTQTGGSGITNPQQLPSLTHAQRDAIASPVAGMVIYDATDNTISVYNGSSWVENTSLDTRSYTFKARTTSSGENYVGGFYFFSAADANLTQASTTETVGDTNVPYAGHAFLVAAAAGSTDGSDLVVTVSGTSITDAGVRTGADSEVIIGAGAAVTACQVNATSATTDLYCETDKKWLGQVTYTLSSSGGSAFSFDFNYGLAKYEDFGNRDFTLSTFECTGLSQANDGDFNIELIQHQLTGWTYSAAAFDPGPNKLLDMNSIHGAEQDVDASDPFAFKRTGLATAVAGSAFEGLIIKVTTGVNNSIAYMNCHTGAQL